MRDERQEHGDALAPRTMALALAEARQTWPDDLFAVLIFAEVCAEILDTVCATHQYQCTIYSEEYKPGHYWRVGDGSLAYCQGFLEGQMWPLGRYVVTLGARLVVFPEARRGEILPGERLC